ncbi:MAG TPA: hypothetical protein VMY99_04445 [Nevskiaceae bacterium]|nr:hypothetical protein [Nevskiaceae bacterium]
MGRKKSPNRETKSAAASLAGRRKAEFDRALRATDPKERNEALGAAMAAAILRTGIKRGHTTRELLDQLEYPTSNSEDPYQQINDAYAGQLGYDNETVPDSSVPSAWTDFNPGGYSPAAQA